MAEYRRLIMSGLDNSDNEVRIKFRSYDNDCAIVQFTVEDKIGSSKKFNTYLEAVGYITETLMERNSSYPMEIYREDKYLLSSFESWSMEN